MSESTTGLVDHLLHSRPTGTRLVHFPVVRPTFGHLVNTFSSSSLSPEPSLTCLGPSLGTSLSHLRPPHISWLFHHSQVCCSTAVTNPNSNSSSEGSPSGLGRDDKPVLNSSSKNKTSSEIPDNAYVQSVRPAREINLSIQIAPFTQRQNFTQTNALLDSGTNTIFINKTWAETHKVPLSPLRNPIPVYNVDGTCNSAGSITHFAELVVEFQGHCEKVTAEVTDLGKNPFILGFSWLQHHNPEIDWTKGTVKMTCCPHHCHMLQDKPVFIQEMEEEEYNNQYYIHETIHTLEAQQESQKPREKTPEELVPMEYHKYLNVFSKKESERMPIRKPGIMQ